MMSGMGVWLCISAMLLAAATWGRTEAVAPLPEAEQATLALKVLDAFHGPRPARPPKLLRVVYFTPADRDPVPRYRERLTAVLEDIRAFYRDELARQGFGPRTFELERDADGKVVIHVVKGKEPEAGYPRADWGSSDGGDGDKIMKECLPTLEAAGISPADETILVFCNLANWDEKAHTYSHHSPFYGAWTRTQGVCFVTDSPILDLGNLLKREPMVHDRVANERFGDVPMGKRNSMLIGSIAHELGHAFSLQHCGERWDEKAQGKSLMGMGNLVYRDERRGEDPGAYLAFASALKLAGRPIFSGLTKGNERRAVLEHYSLILSTNLTNPRLAGRRGRLRLEGTVKGAPPVYGVIAYFDSVRDGGYEAPAATAVPDAEGRFALEVSDLAPTENGKVLVEFCHVNAGVSTEEVNFAVRPDGGTDISHWELAQALEPVAGAVVANQLAEAQAALEKLEKSPAPPLAKVVARKLVATLRAEPKPVPADAAPSVTELALGDARPQAAEVGWLEPAANRIPRNQQVASPLLDVGKIYATGLYGHPPSKYVFDLGGKWKELRGEAGLHTAFQDYGAVSFILKTDGKEAFHSRVIRRAKLARYQLDVTGVKALELIVKSENARNAGTWGLWLDPTLSR